MPADDATRIQGLGDLIRHASSRGTAPVDQWDPPYCGDIGLKIDTHGDWHYQNSVISRPALVQLFARVLRCEKDGKHYLVTPVEKVDVQVADAPFLAVEMQVDGRGPDQRLTFRTNIDDVIVADAEHPLLFREEAKSGGMKPYVRVRSRLYARLTRALYFELVDWFENTDAADPDQLSIMSSGVAFPVVDSDANEFYNFDV